MERIQKVSSYFVWIFTALLVIEPLWKVGLWFSLETGFVKNLIKQNMFGIHIAGTPHQLNLDTSLWMGTIWWLVIGSSLVGLIPQLLTFASLRTIFKNYREGKIFTVANARQYGYIGFYFFLTALVTNPLGNTLMILAATWTNPPGHRTLSISFGTVSLEDLFYGMLLIIISWIMKEASKLQAEQQLTI